MTQICNEFSVLSPPSPCVLTSASVHESNAAENVGKATQALNEILLFEKINMLLVGDHLSSMPCDASGMHEDG